MVDYISKEDDFTCTNYSYYTRSVVLTLKFYFQVQLANQNQLGDHYGSKHPKEKPPSESG